MGYFNIEKHMFILNYCYITKNATIRLINKINMSMRNKIEKSGSARGQR